MARRISASVDGSRPHVCGRGLPTRHVLELHDLLRHAVFEELDLGLLRSVTGLSPDVGYMSTRT